MTRDIDATDGMQITVGNRQKVTATVYMMTGHTPGSMAMIVPVKYEGKDHPILIVTAGNAFPNINAFIGGYEHIWDIGIQQKVESVMQAHPNTNMNLLARTKYVNDNYGKIPKNPSSTGRADGEVNQCAGVLARPHRSPWNALAGRGLGITRRRGDAE
jgi:hypothetical protein